MPEIKGILEEYEKIKGVPLTKLNPEEKIEDLKIVVSGIEFYRTIWVPSTKTLKRYERKTEPEAFSEIFTQEYYFPREEFFNDLEKNINKKVKVEFENVAKGIVYQGWDRYIHKVKIPRRHREIVDVEFLEE